jgi:Tfp pilus assembly protein PilO
VTQQFTLARLPWPAQAGVGLGVSAACAACFHVFWAAPVRDDLALRERALATAHRELAAAMTAARRLPEGRRAVAALGARLDALRGADVHNADGPAVLREVQAFAEESELWITGFKPTPPAHREGVAEWSVALEFEGTYASVVAFLQRVADDSRLLGVSALRLRAHEHPDGERTVTGACRLTTFVPYAAAAAADVAPGTASPVSRTGTGEHAESVGLP